MADTPSAGADPADVRYYDPALPAQPQMYFPL